MQIEWQCFCRYKPTNEEITVHYFKNPLAIAILMSGVAASVAHAQTAPAPPVAPAAPALAPEKAAEPPAPEPIFSIGGFDLTGHIDVGHRKMVSAELST